MPWLLGFGCHMWTVSQTPLVKQLTGQLTDVWVHSILYTTDIVSIKQSSDERDYHIPEQMHSIRVVLLETDEQRLVILKFAGLRLQIRQTYKTSSK
jgi:hypothetical protein